jgi:hypothetical protein
MTFMEAITMSGLARPLFVLSYVLSKEGCPYSVEEEATAV